MTVKFVDTMVICDDCIHCRPAGDVMVGIDATGGGPEEAFTCAKGKNMTSLALVWGRDETCPAWDDGWDDY